MKQFYIYMYYILCQLRCYSDVDDVIMASVFIWRCYLITQHQSDALNIVPWICSRALLSNRVIEGINRRTSCFSIRLKAAGCTAVLILTVAV